MKKEQDQIRVRCSVCGLTVTIKDMRVIEHKSKFGQSPCYGSFMPIFQDARGSYTVGNIMFFPQKGIEANL